MRLISRLLLSLLVLVPLGLSAATAAEPLQEGRDYELIDAAAPFAPLAGKIEVVEIFGYTCPHCAHFEPLLTPWAARQRADVRVTLLPAAFGGSWDSWARAYFAAEQLGVAKRSHAAVFKALHEDGSLPRQNVGADELARFYQAYGVDPAAFEAALRSDAVTAKLAASRAFAVRAGVQGTPQLVINGRYRVRGQSFPDQLRIADALIAGLRSGKIR